MWPQMYFLDLQQLDHWLNGWKVSSSLAVYHHAHDAVMIAAVCRRGFQKGV